MSLPLRQPVQKERRAEPREADIIAMPMPAREPVSHREPAPQIERIGDLLRRTRQRRGDDLQPIADYLCIRRSFLEALEESRYETFAADAYVIGFLRSYADLLGLDGQQVIEAYRAERAGLRHKPSLILPTPLQEGRSPSAFVLIGAVIAAIFIYVLWYGFSTSDRGSASVAPALPAAAETTTAPSAAAVAPIVVPAATAVAQPAVVEAPPPATTKTKPSDDAASHETTPDSATTAAAAKPPHLVVRAEQSSWILISGGKGETIFDRVLKPGESFQVPDKPGLMLTTGNGAGVVLVLDGVDLPRLSTKPTSTMRDIALSPAHLKSLAAPRD